VTGTGLTVPGGDPAALRQLAAQLRTAAQRSGSLGSNTGDVTGAITSDAQWTGTASNSFSTFSANLSEGTSAAEAPLNRIADAVENYANVLDVAQQKAQTANAIFQTAQDDPTGSLISTAEQYGQDAMDALDALQQAGDQAAGQVNSAADDLQVGSLFGAQGPWACRSRPFQWGLRGRSSTTMRTTCPGLTAPARFILDQKAFLITCLLTGRLRISSKYRRISRKVSRPGSRSRSTWAKNLDIGPGSTRSYGFSGRCRRN
jgi:uncharacterized protein YukE